MLNWFITIFVIYESVIVFSKKKDLQRGNSESLLEQ